MKEEKENISFLAKWTKFFIEKYKVSILFIVAIIIAGIWGVSNIQRQDFPAIESNYVFVQAKYIGASSSDVESKILVPIEQVVSTRDDVDNVRSSASANFGSVIIERKSADGNEDAVSEISEEVGSLGLPQDAEVDVESLDVAGVSMVLGVVDEGDGDNNFDHLLEEAEDIKTRIESSSNNIKKVEILPENEFQIKIQLDSTKMADKSLDYNTVKNTLSSYITSLPGGNIKEDDKEISIKINSTIGNIDDIKKLEINGTKLEDIAEIDRKPTNDEVLTFGGYKVGDETKTNDAVYLLVYKTDEGDIVRLADGVQKEIDDLKSENVLTDDVEVRVLYNLAPSITEQIKSLVNNGLIGLVVILIVLLFFINFRTAIVVSLIIPLAFLITLFVLPLLGYSLNILTLFAMILTLGILVDNAIVIAEGMAYEMHNGATKREAAVLAVKHLGPAVTAATLTTIIAFVPFSQMPGIMGDFLKYIPYTVIIMLVVSYFLAISITPLLGTWILKDEDAKDEFAGSEKENANQCKLSTTHGMSKLQKSLIIPVIIRWGQNLINKVNMHYCKAMHWLLEKKVRKVTTIVIALVLLFISMGYFLPKLQFEQFPSKDGSNLSVSYDFPVEMTFDEKKDIIKKVNEEIIELPHFQKFYNYNDVTQIEITDPAKRDDDVTIFNIKDELDEKVAKIKEDVENDDVEIKVDDISYGPPASEYDIVVEFLSNDSEVLEKSTDELAKYLDGEEGVQKYENVLKEGLIKNIDIEFSEDKLSEFEVDPLVASGIVNATFSDSTLGQISSDDEKSSDIVLGYDEDSKNSIDKIRELSIPSNKAETVVTNPYAGTTLSIPVVVKLDEVADVNEVEKPQSIQRYKSERVGTVNILLKDGYDATEFEQKIKNEFNEDKLKELGLESDGLSFGGQLAEFQSDYSNLQIIFVLAAIFVFLVLVFQFNSYSQPLLIMTTIPLALIGVFPGLYVIDPSINLVSGLGIIALVGIVVNDAIVFVDTMNRFTRENPENSTADNLVKTGFTRLKPIFSTSITTIAGILPLTIVDPFWTGLGVAIIFGLIFSTVGTLIVVPVIYHSFTRKK